MRPAKLASVLCFAIGMALVMSETAKAAEIRVVSGGAFKQVLNALAAQYQTESVNTLALTYQTVGQHLALIRDGNIIELDAEKATLDVKLSPGELERRARDWKPRAEEFTSGYLWKYVQQVGAARQGAVTHPGGLVEKACYADI